MCFTANNFSSKTFENSLIAFLPLCSQKDITTKTCNQQLPAKYVCLILLTECEIKINLIIIIIRA